MRFTQTSLTAVLASSFLFLSASALQAQTTMRINISTVKDSHQGIAIDTFASEVAKRTQGGYLIKTFYASSLSA
jgi:TRAP-type transport system periplasmic protein